MKTFYYKQVLFKGALFCLLSFLAIFLHIFPAFNLQTFVLSMVSLLAYTSLILCLENTLKDWARIILYISLIIFSCFNVEHILVNNSNINFGYWGLATDASLFSESVFTLRFLSLILFSSTLFMLSLLAEIKLSFRLKKVSHFIFLSIPLILFTLDLSIDHNIFYQRWFQKNIISANALNFSQQFNLHLNTEINPSHQSSSNLGGKKLVNIVPPKKIIILQLEGFSQIHLNLGLAPNLRNLSQKSYLVPYFFNNQVQTNRGLYAIQCGQSPNLILEEAKADLFIDVDRNYQCLGEILNEKGFENYFMQSAPLHFMRKDLFAKESGFNFAVGADSFDPKYILSEWGIGDFALLKGAIKVLKENPTKKLYISLLTVGTHHPYKTPESSNDFEKAIQYTDRIVGEFYRALEEINYFDDGILMITSDETKLPSGNFTQLDHNRGLMFILGNQLPKEANLHYFTQTDILPSILDILGIKHTRRSFFREVKNFEYFLGNTFLKHIIYLNKREQFTLCRHDFHCLDINFKEPHMDQIQIKGNSSLKIQSHVQNFVRQNDLSSKEKPFLFRENNISIKPNSTHLFMAEFKTDPQYNHYIIDLKFEGLLKNVKLSHSFYSCGIANPKQDHIFQVSSAKQNFKIDIPQEFKGRTLCHTSQLNNSSQEVLSLKEYSFSGEAR
ncbi:MAG: hypothetical protein CME65_07965 [Halobacteriovoraceae bacterium]|nr:hypothetical protein [Halobacteriovoraceae bacterium]|tara:strand:- start:3438 stop:5450 length:2013 start_codon:yes stop_codon:yes gene_type:complete